MSVITERPAVADAIETVESHLHPTPSWDIDDHAVPTGREEIWRFSPIKRLKGVLEGVATGEKLHVDGELPAGVTRTEISAAAARDLAVSAPRDRVAAQAVANSNGAVLFDISAETEIADPVVITLTGTGQTVHGHLIIRIGAFAKVTFVIKHEGSAKYANKTDVIIGDQANVNLVTIQDWADDAVHGGQTDLSVGRDAQVRTVSVSIGGDVVRLSENSEFAGPGGSLEQFGLYLVDAGQHIEHRLFVDHNAPHTKSNVDYRGALQGKGAHSVWIGDVLIRKVAEGIETYESNKNLVLTDGCQADSVPNLEIETGEIAGAGHASTTGRFDDEQLFYLRSRGIPEAEARRLVVHGFFNDIVRRIGVPEIEAHLRDIVENELRVVQ